MTDNQAHEATVDDHLRSMLNLMKRGARISLTDIPNDPTFLSSHIGAGTAQAISKKIEGLLDAGRHGRTKDPHAYLVQAIREISELRDSEAAEPFDDALDIADAALSAYAAPTPPAAVQEPVADNGPWCQPRYEGKDHPRKFMVVYEDADMGSALFEDETEARSHFEAASITWNCYLFGLLPRSALSTSQSDPAPETRAGGISDEDRNYLEEVADGAWGDDPRTRGLARDRLKAIDAEPPRLTSGERFMLEWLSKEESSALGECEGGDLAHLEQMSLAVIVPIEGKHRHYSRVSLTDAGRAALSATATEGK